MPHFTLQITAQGPLLSAYVGVSAARQQALTEAGLAVPPAARITALLDTGATGTCVDISVLQSLNLTPTGQVVLHTPSTGDQPVPADQYDVGLIVPAASQTQAPLIILNQAVICASLFTAFGFQALIGRDVLAQCTLWYNGSTSRFTLSY